MRKSLAGALGRVTAARPRDGVAQLSVQHGRTRAGTASATTRHSGTGRTQRTGKAHTHRQHTIRMQRRKSEERNLRRLATRSCAQSGMDSTPDQTVLQRGVFHADLTDELRLAESLSSGTGAISHGAFHQTGSLRHSHRSIDQRRSHALIN